MSIVPGSVRKYTSNLSIAIYFYASTRWHEAVDNAIEIIDSAFGVAETRLAAIESYLVTHSDFVADEHPLDSLGLAKAIGNINRPLMQLATRNGINLLQGAGAATFTCATAVKNYTDRYGVVQATAAIDTPRFEKKGLSLDGDIVNSCLQSESLATAPWSNTATIGASVEAAGLTLDLVTDDDVASHEHAQQDVVVVNDASTHAVSIYAKQSGADDLAQVRVRFINGTATTDVFDIDWATLTVDHTIIGACALLGVDLLADGVMRIRVSATNNNTGNTLLRTQCRPAAKNSLVTDTGACYFGAAQIELNKSFVSSYVETAAAAVTVQADSLIIDAHDNWPKAGDDYVLRVVFSCDGVATSNTLVAVYDGVSSTTRLRVNTAGLLLFTMNGLTVASSSTVVADGVERTAEVHVDGANGMAYLYIDGLLESSGSGTDAYGTPTEIHIGSTVAAQQLYGHISEAWVYAHNGTADEARVAA